MLDRGSPRHGAANPSTVTIKMEMARMFPHPGRETTTDRSPEQIRCRNLHTPNSRERQYVNV